VPVGVFCFNDAILDAVYFDIKQRYCYLFA